MAGLPMTTELKLRRSLVHRDHDMKRLADGEDLNDALLDFFVKLGQAVIPCGGLEGGHPSVAYLGSLFYDMLRKGGTKDGRESHAAVANWAKRRLGQGGLFFDGIGALAVPVNETLQDNQGRKSSKERHWWLALVLNPRGGSRRQDDEEVALLCLDSVARAEMRLDPPLRALRQHHPGYPLEVTNLYRQGFVAFVRFRARGDGSAGPLPDPRNSKLTASGREFTRPRATLSVDQRGGNGTAGHIEGLLEFELDSSLRTCGDYSFDFGGEYGSYIPAIRITVRREAHPFQQEVAHLLGGYIAKEWSISNVMKGQAGVDEDYDAARVGLRLPDVPQQETANDCGYFILEQILLALQLTPEGFRTLIRASTNMVTALPWPSQKQVSTRKAKLREALQALFQASDQMLSDDVEVLLRSYPDLRRKVQSSLWDGPRFSEAVRTLGSTALPQQEFSVADLDSMSTKNLRSLCLQRGALPPGTVERAELIQVLVPLASKGGAVDKATALETTAPSVAPHAATPAAAASPNSAATAAAGSVPVASHHSREEEPAAKRPKTMPPEHLGEMRFTEQDLQTMPMKTLRGLCIQHRVLPSNALERADFVLALIPIAESHQQQPRQQQQKPQQSQPPTGKQAADEGLENRSGHGRNGAEEDLASRKARWAQFAEVGRHLSGVCFDAQDLGVMPLKTLKAFCVQHGVLPACAVERADFVRALAPLAGKAAPGGNKAEAVRTPAPTATHAAAGPTATPSTAKASVTRKDYSKFLGAAKPNFTEADLEDMPESTLRTLCIQHGVLQDPSAGRALLLASLRRLARPPGAPEPRAPGHTPPVHIVVE